MEVAVMLIYCMSSDCMRSGCTFDINFSATSTLIFSLLYTFYMYYHSIIFQEKCTYFNKNTVCLFCVNRVATSVQRAFFK